MGKPLNHDDPGCNPISSNCVIWQGPDIPCIHLCKGDSVSDVVYKLATELCTIMDVLNISTYQDALACFNLAIGAGAPTNFQQLIELLTARICNLEECTGCRPDCNGESEMVLPDNVSTPCCDAPVPIADCFYYVNELGDTVTTLPLSDYVHAIGNKLCLIIAQLATQNLVNEDLLGRVANLESEPVPTYVPPAMTPACVSASTDPFVVLTALESQFCALRNATGDPNQIYSEIITPAGLNNAQRLCPPGGPMSSLTGWDNVGGTMAAAVGNIWLSIMDLRCAVQNALLCCPSGCDAVSIGITGVMAGNVLQISFYGSIPAGYNDCGGQNMFTITDSAGAFTNIYINITGYMTTGTSYNLDVAGAGLNPVLDLTISTTACIGSADGTVQCEKCIEFVMANEASCPEITVTPTTTTFTYTFNSASGTNTYTIQLWTDDLSTMVASQSYTTTSAALHGGTFVGLTPNTNYRLRMLITVNTETTTCPDISIATLPEPCYAPTFVVATVAIDPVP